MLKKGRDFIRDKNVSFYLQLGELPASSTCKKNSRRKGDRKGAGRGGGKELVPRYKKMRSAPIINLTNGKIISLGKSRQKKGPGRSSHKSTERGEEKTVGGEGFGEASVLM